MTPESTKKNEPAFRAPNPAELKAAAEEDSILERQSHEVEGDINEEHTEAERVDTVDADIDDRPVAEEMSNSQTVKANISGH